MKCPKCGYVSHDYLDACRKCSTDWVAFKQELRLSVLEPGDLDLSLAMDADGERYANREAFGVDDSFFTAQTLLVDREERPRDDGYDIELDDELDPDDAGTSYTGAALGAHETPAGAETSKGSDFVMISPTESDETQFIDLAAVEEQIAAARGAVAPESPVEGTQAPPVDMIDMSDLGDLGGDTLSTTTESARDADAAGHETDVSVEVELEADEDREYVSELEAADVEAEEMSAEDAFTLEPEASELPDDLSEEALSNMDLEATVMIENVFASETADAAPVVPKEEAPPEVSDDPALNETVQIERPGVQPASSPAPAAAEGIPDLITDDLFETELELELEDEVETPALEGPPLETAPDTLLDVEAFEIEEDDETKS